MTYCAREWYAVRMRQFLVGFYGTCRCTRSISPSGKKMYFLKQDPLRHGEWKLLDIMKNNSRVHTRKRKTASDTEFVTDAKSEKFFPTPFPDKCKRGQRALGANRKRERFTFCYVDETGRRVALDCRGEMFDDYFNIPADCVSATD